MNRRRERMYIYHKSRTPKIVRRVRFSGFEGGGWHDSPLTLAKLADFGVDPDDAAAVQALGQCMQGLRDYCNCAINVSLMNRTDLIGCAQTHFDKDFEFDTGVKLMRRQLKELFIRGAG